LLVGVFDLFHFGHLRLLKRAAKLGDYLVAAIQTDEYVVKFKPDSIGAFYSLDERMEMIRALRCVDEVISYNSIENDIKNIQFDIFVKGPDQVHAGFAAAAKWCEENGKSVIVLPRTEGVSSTYIKRIITDLQTQNINS